MSLSTYWLLPPRWSSCPKEEISSILDQAFGSADDAQERTPDSDQHPAEGGVIALAVGPTDANYDFTPHHPAPCIPHPIEYHTRTSPRRISSCTLRSSPGFRMLDDCPWPSTPESARLRTGIYIQGRVPITACQWAWIHSDGTNDFLLTATATMTTPAFSNLNEDVLAIIMSLEVRNG